MALVQNSMISNLIKDLLDDWLCLAITSPDNSYVVRIVNQFMHAPKIRHLKMLYIRI